VKRHHSFALAAFLAGAAILAVTIPARSGSRGATVRSAQARASLSASLPGKEIGSKDAPIVIEVFSDFECPACRSFYETTLRQVIDNYVSTGKVLLIHRDFPLQMHAYSREAARWADAAAEIGYFQTVESTLFGKQDVWGANGKIEDVLSGALSAADMKKLREAESKYSSQIEASIAHDLDLGNQKHILQTPTVFVTAKGKTEELPGGGVSYPLMKQYLDYLLRQ